MEPATLEAIAREVAKQSSSHGGEIWIASLILVVVGLLGGLATWKIWIPNAISMRENNAKLAEVVAAIGQVTSQTHKGVEETRILTTAMNERTRDLVMAARVLLDAMQIIAKKSEVDISQQIGEARGLLSE